MAINSELVDRMHRDPFAGHLGITLEEVRPGYARLTMTVGPEHVNFNGSCHGGAIFSLLDAAHAAASNSHGTMAAAMNVHIEFVTPALVGDQLVAEGVEEECGRRTALYHLTVRKSDGRLVASGQGRVFRYEAH